MGDAGLPRGQSGDCASQRETAGGEAPHRPPAGEGGRGRGPPALKRVASFLFLASFVLGVLNAAYAIIGIAGVSTPDETHVSGTCELSGEVRDTAGRPIVCATVIVTDASLSALTDESGWYVIKGIPPGVHRVEATAPGYNRMSVRVDLRPSLLKSMDFTLEYGGADFYLDEALGESFSEPVASLLWTVPLLLSCSVCALAAALLSLGRRPGRLALALGAASIPSLGFGVGSALAAFGTVALALHITGCRWLRRARRPAGAPGPVMLTNQRWSAGSGEKASATGATPPPGQTKMPAPAPSPMEGGEGGERETCPEEIRGRVARYAIGRRRISQERALCCVCIEEIHPGQRYIKCVCGRRMHFACVQEPKCPECGHPFRAGK
ncbi:MAG: carboxypeptidase regulatory-like domain-containing protein [Thermoplasmata archaeon]